MSLFSSSNDSGLTLVEMVIVIAIVGIVSSVAVFDYIAQRDVTALETTSEQVVAIIRQAQSYGTAVRPHGGSFDVGYGVLVRQGSSEFELFVVPKDSDGNYDYDDIEIIETFTMSDGIEVAELENIPGNHRLGIVFVRPRIAPYLDAVNPGNQANSVDEVTITLESPRDRTKDIIITTTGQIGTQR